MYVYSLYREFSEETRSLALICISAYNVILLWVLLVQRLNSNADSHQYINLARYSLHTCRTQNLKNLKMNFKSTIIVFFAAAVSAVYAGTSTCNGATAGIIIGCNNYGKRSGKGMNGRFRSTLKLISVFLFIDPLQADVFEAADGCVVNLQIPKKYSSDIDFTFCLKAGKLSIYRAEAPQTWTAFRGSTCRWACV